MDELEKAIADTWRRGVEWQACVDRDWELEMMRTALRKLSKEVRAILSISEFALREDAGHTNVNCLLNRVRESELLLEHMEEKHGQPTP